MSRRTLTHAMGPLMALALAAAAPVALGAQDTNPMPMGPGMMGPGYGMGGYGPGMGRGYGMGMGPCPMGGYGMGMMGMGPGMMGMGQHMMGPGMGMGYGPMGHLWMLDLTDEQQDKLGRIRNEVVKKQRALMTQLWAEQDQLQELYAADTRDTAAIGKAYAKVADLQRQAFMTHLEAEKKMEEVLTKEQKAQLRRGYRRWGRMGW